MELHTIWARLKVQKSKEHIPYYISIDGNIISDSYIDTRGGRRQGRGYVSVKDTKGYHRIALNKYTYITPSLARNVALHFIPNLLGKPETNHIDGNKDNNNVENLEWCTTKENIQHAIKLGLREAITPGLSVIGTNALWARYKRPKGSRNNSILELR
jgi:hypothetical protein